MLYSRRHNDKSHSLRLAGIHLHRHLHLSSLCRLPSLHDSVFSLPAAHERLHLSSSGRWVQCFSPWPLLCPRRDISCSHNLLTFKSFPIMQISIRGLFPIDFHYDVFLKSLEWVTSGKMSDKYFASWTQCAWMPSFTSGAETESFLKPDRRRGRFSHGNITHMPQVVESKYIVVVHLRYRYYIQFSSICYFILFTQDAPLQLNAVSRLSRRGVIVLTWDSAADHPGSHQTFYPLTHPSIEMLTGFPPAALTNPICSSAPIHQVSSPQLSACVRWPLPCQGFMYPSGAISPRCTERLKVCAVRSYNAWEPVWFLSVRHVSAEKFTFLPNCSITQHPSNLTRGCRVSLQLRVLIRLVIRFQFQCDNECFIHINIYDACMTHQSVSCVSSC